MSAISFDELKRRGKKLRSRLWLPTWDALFAKEKAKPYWSVLMKFLEEERKEYQIFPPAGAEFKALELTPLHTVRAVILGQDPYFTPGAAMGLCFSVPEGAPIQPSLSTILAELRADVGVEANNGDLTPWATHGILLLNTVLTVRAGEALSHAGYGWEQFTDAVMMAVNWLDWPVGFLLMGKDAQRRGFGLNTQRHALVQVPHPAARDNSFRGTRPFSKMNFELEKRGADPINWGL